ncbi:MAG: hypothetical protein NT069_05875 [Planctomycetota bacterium]|nr:hypothetical protein [Planctomycetota bacterium]
MRIESLVDSVAFVRTGRAKLAFALALPLAFVGLADIASAQQKAKPKAATKPAPAVEAAPAKAPDPDANEDLTLLAREDVLAFLESLGNAVDEGKLADFNRHIDWDGLSATASRGFQIPPKSKGKFLSEFRAAQDQDSGFSGQVIRSATTGGSYTLVKIHEVGNDMRALFRMVLPDDAGFNYHDYVLKRVGDAVKVADIYIYGSGELLTSTMRRAMIISAATQGPEWLKGLTGRDLDMAKAAKIVREYSDLAAKPDAEGVLALYAKLPKSVQGEKGVLLVRLYAATLIDEATQAKAMADIRKADPKDFAGDMQCLSSYLSSQRYDEFQKVVSRLNKEVGGDPYLNVVLAGMRVELQEYAAARKLLEAAVDADETLIDAWWSLVTVSLREKKFDKAIECLNKLATDFNVDVGDVTRNPEYADFVKSKEYSKWKKPSVAKKGETTIR